MERQYLLACAVASEDSSNVPVKARLPVRHGPLVGSDGLPQVGEDAVDLVVLLAGHVVPGLSLLGISQRAGVIWQPHQVGERAKLGHVLPLVVRVKDARKPHAIATMLGADSEAGVEEDRPIELDDLQDFG
jgi:hypothetical protein